MVKHCSPSNQWFTISALVAALAATPVFFIGCGGAPSGGQTTSSDPTLSDSNAQTTFEGSVSGVMTGSRSTRDSVAAADGESAAQALPTDSDPVQGVVSLLDLHGDPLLGPDGKPYPPVPTDAAGAFLVSNLPVGVDFVIASEIDGDGKPDIQQIVQIPVDEVGDEGHLDGVVIDPLSTLVAARLRQLLVDSGIDLRGLHISPTAVVHRVVDAYIHLFDEAGIDSEVTLEDIAALDDRSLASLFESLIPPAVRAGFEAVEGNLALGHAVELEDAVRAAAEVFIRSGFPIADGPGGIDLSFLAELPDVEVKSIEDMMPHDSFVPDDAMVPPDMLAPAQLEEILDDVFDGPFGELIDDDMFGPGDGEFPDSGPPFPPMFDAEPPTIYFSTVSEPDRNFAGDENFDKGPEFHHLPILNEHLLARMAGLHLQGRVITLGNLYRLLTDVEVGLGARLTYAVPTPAHEGPPPMMFETADGLGTARDVEALMFSLMLSGLSDPRADFNDLRSHEAAIRDAMRELLDGTVPPTFHRLFGTVVSERLESVEQLFRFIREAKAHLPFSRSGPSRFFVVADGNPFGPEGVDAVNPVTVDVEFDEHGLPARIIYSPSQSGRFYLGFMHETDEHHIAEPIVIERGRRLHGPHGKPILLDMDDGDLFAPIDGRPFIEFVSESGMFYPTIPVTVSNPDFRFGEPTGTPEIAPANTEPGPDPTMHRMVLATEPGPDGLPVRVDYSITDGTFTYTPDGRYYVTLVPETPQEGVFGLYDTDLNLAPTVHDLTADRFIETLPPPPDGVGPPPPDGTIPPPDEMFPPPDGIMPGDDQPSFDTNGAIPPAEDTTTNSETPSDGNMPPDTGMPPDDVLPPPTDGTAPPPNEEQVRITPAQIIGLDVEPKFFTFVFGTDAPNPNYNPDGNPYFDDQNDNGTEDPGELTTDHRPVLFDPHDWRSTDMEHYYRRASGGGVTFEDIDFSSPEPRTRDGEVLVPRNFLPRRNAFAYGRPNSAISLLITFMPPEFFDGRHALGEDTELSILQAVAMINLVMEQVFNVEGRIDIDGDGPLEEMTMLVDAHLFVLPIGDPFVLLLEGFDRLSTAKTQE